MINSQTSNKVLPLGKLVATYPKEICCNEDFTIEGSWENAHHIAIFASNKWYKFAGDEFLLNLSLQALGANHILITARNTESASDQNTDKKSETIIIQVVENYHKKAISKFVSIAINEYKKDFVEVNNITPYGEWYGMNGQPWCAMFVSYCANEANISEHIIPKFAYCPSGLNWYKKNKRYYSASSTYTPAVGDLVFFACQDDPNRVPHVGIAISYDELTKSVTTVEGNVQNKVVSRVFKLSSSAIKGYGSNS